MVVAFCKPSAEDGEAPGSVSMAFARRWLRLRPNTVSFNTVLSACARTAQANAAFPAAAATS